MTDKELIKDVLELLQLIHTSHHTLLPTNPPKDPWVYHKVNRKIEDMAERLNDKLKAETEQPTTRKLGFDDALKIAHGCFDYMGGYRDDNLYIYHHGIQTVVNCLEGAKEKGLKDSQIRAVHIIGTEEIERQMKQPEQKPWVGLTDEDMDNNDIEHFHIYAKELTLPITLKSLIESHKNLHHQNKIKHDEWLRELSAARELGRKQGLEMVTECEYVSIEKLKSMTINELVSFLYDGEQND